MIFITTLLKKKFDAELLFTDISSLTYEIKSEAVYEEFLKHKDLFESFLMGLIKSYWQNER